MFLWLHFSLSFPLLTSFISILLLLLLLCIIIIVVVDDLIYSHYKSRVSASPLSLKNNKQNRENKKIVSLDMDRGWSGRRVHLRFVWELNKSQVRILWDSNPCLDWKILMIFVWNRILHKRMILDSLTPRQTDWLKWMYK